MVTTRQLLDMRTHLLAITAWQWLLLGAGVVAGAIVWGFISRRLVGRITRNLGDRSFRANGLSAVEGLLGGMVVLANAGLVYLSTRFVSCFLFAFSVVGLLVGAWITMPASFE